MDRPDKLLRTMFTLADSSVSQLQKYTSAAPVPPPELHRPSPSDASAWGRRNYVVITASSPRGHHAAVPSGADQLLVFISGRPICAPSSLFGPYWVYISLGSPLPSKSHIRFPNDDIFASFLLLPPWSRLVLAIRCVSPCLPHHDAQ